jgi:PAS domain S-box-containing protein
MKRKSKVRKAAISHKNARKPFCVAPKESEEIVLAIRRGKIDALVISGSNGEQVLTLQGTDHPYRVLVETISDGVATLDQNGVVLYANLRFSTILRVPPEKFIGSSLLTHVSTAECQVLRDLIAQGLSNSSQGEIKLAASEDRPRLVRLSVNPVKNSEPPTVCVVATEMTEIVEANEALKVNEEALRQLSARLLKLQDEERRHIARDLHDITGQKLAVQSMALAQILNRTVTGTDPESHRILSECAALNKQVAEEIRTLSYLLHPPLLDELGLSSAVKWYAEGFEARTGIKLKVEIASDFARFPPEVEVALFRVIQESLSNVQRYSFSPNAFVTLKADDLEIQVQIGDFGKGMDRNIWNAATGKVAPLGVGIQGMRERIRQLSGKLEINSKSNKGTLVTATLPLANLATRLPALRAETPDAGRRTMLSEPSPSRAATSRKQILLVDDHELLRQGVRSMLQKETDLEICGEAIDGRDAIDKVIALRPDLVILDINLPILNGIASVRQILRLRPQTKILVFTVDDSEQTLKEILATGARGILPKSKGDDDLLRVVRTVLETENSSSAAATH